MALPTIPTQVNTPVEESRCFIQWKIRQAKFVWTIKHITSCRERMQVLMSSTFPAGTVNDWKWKLRINATDESGRYLSAYLFLASSSKKMINAMFEISILNARKEKTNTMKTTEALTFVPGQYRGFEKFILRDFLLDDANGLIRNGIITISCEVSVLEASENVSKQSNEKPVQVSDSQFLSDFTKMFSDQKLTDVTVVVGGKEFPAHKAVLAARSRVFAAILDEMEKSKRNHLEIENFDPEVFRVMLRFIYTGNTNIPEEMAGNLLAAADKYALGRLKAMCEEVLCKSLTVENVAETLVLAHFHSAYQLKTEAYNFINVHAIGVLETAGYKSIAQAHPILTDELFSAIVKENEKENM